MDNRDFKGIWIPREVYLDKTIPWTAKVIFLEIHSFSEDGKECFMSNEYLGEFVDLTPTQVSRHISKLKAKGWIELVSFDGTRRVLKSLMTCGFPQSGIDKKRKAESKKNANPPKQKAQKPIDEKRKDTNTVNNTATNTTYDFKNDYAFFTDLYFQFYELTFKTKPIFTEISGKKLKEILKKLETKNRESITRAETENRDLRTVLWSKERAAKLLVHFFRLAITDKWLKENFELANLDSKFNSIITKEATNATTPTTTPFDRK